MAEWPAWRWTRQVSRPPHDPHYRSLRERPHHVRAQEHLRQAIEARVHTLRAGIPPDRVAAIIALVRAQDRLSRSPDSEPLPDLITGHRLTNLGGNLALRLCLEATGEADGAAIPGHEGWDDWSRRFREECGRLAEAELVLGHVETGFMRLAEDGAGACHAWIATRRAPTSWRERADVDWWAAWLASRHEPELRALRAEQPRPQTNERERDAHYLRLAAVHLERMGYQLGYPADAVLGGCAVETYRAVLGQLIAWALQERDSGQEARPQPRQALIAALAAALASHPEIIGRAVAGFTLDRESAAWHAAVPGVAAAPLVRIDGEQVVWSLFGLTTEPFFFLTRELKRRDAQEYHNSAHLREGVFREDLYALFPDTRFVTSPGRVALRRAGGDVRTDIDAIVFDRKSGTLAFFELKSQDPFARSIAELTRQRDNVLYANRQVSGVLAWLKQHGGDALLGRFASRTAKTFRVQKVYPLVLGRYLAHFGDGPRPDGRAAWGTWPQLLRLLDGQPVRAGDANPIASLSSRLMKDVPSIGPAPDAPAREIAIGEARLVVHPSYAALRAATGEERGSDGDDRRLC